MRTLPTSSELLEGFKRAAEAQVRGRLSPTTGAPVRLSWAPTSFFNLIRVGAVRLAQRCLWVIDREFRASFLDTAEDDDLDAWAASEAPGFPRKGASAALVRLTLTRTTTGAGTIYAGDRFSTVATSTSPAVTFRARVDTPVAANALTVDVDAECESEGPSGNVDAGAVVRVLSPLFATFTVANTARSAGGDAREEDDAYRDRLRQRDARYRRGTRQAVELGARSVPGVTQVTYVSPQTDASVAPGTFRLIVGDTRGIGSQPLADAVSTALFEWASEGNVWAVYPAGTVSVLTATPSPVPAGTVALRFDVTRRRTTATFDRATAERDIGLALSSLSKGLDHGQPLHLLQVTAAVMGAHPTLRNVQIVALDSGGAELGTLAADWPGYTDDPTMGIANRWDIPEAIRRYRWLEE